MTTHIAHTHKDKSARTHADGQCVIYSFGIGFDAGFDVDVAKHMPWCKLLMFDPTPAVVTAAMATTPAVATAAMATPGVAAARAARGA